VLVTDTESILDREQLRDVTLDDPDLMREILDALVDDTSLQLGRLEQAIRDADSSQCARLAHYCKGACANVGARRAAAALLHVERRALAGDIEECAASMAGLTHELELLRGEAVRTINA
jgi:HPt (histidine-containing phosphotransfer) domain-containing protein